SEDGGRAGGLRGPSGRPDHVHAIGVGVGCCVALSTSRRYTWTGRRSRAVRAAQRAGKAEMAVVAENTGITLRTFRGNARRRRKERIVHGLFIAAAGLSLVISAAIILALLEKAIVFLTKVPLGQLWSSGWLPRENQFALPTIIIGTLAISVVAMAVAIPVGLGAAIYLAEYSAGRLRRVLKPILETLAGVPRVGLGFFSLR